MLSNHVIKIWSGYNKSRFHLESVLIWKLRLKITLLDLRIMDLRMQNLSFISSLRCRSARIWFSLCILLRCPQFLIDPSPLLIQNRHFLKFNYQCYPSDLINSSRFKALISSNWHLNWLRGALITAISALIATISN